MGQAYRCRHCFGAGRESNPQPLGLPFDAHVWPPNRVFDVDGPRRRQDDVERAKAQPRFTPRDFGDHGWMKQEADRSRPVRRSFNSVFYFDAVGRDVEAPDVARRAGKIAKAVMCRREREAIVSGLVAPEPRRSACVRIERSQRSRPDRRRRNKACCGSRPNASVGVARQRSIRKRLDRRRRVVRATDNSKLATSP